MSPIFSPRAAFACLACVVCHLGQARAVGPAPHDGLHDLIVRADARIDADPENAAALLERAALQRIHKAWTAALADLDRAAAVQPELPGLAAERGRLLLDVGHLQGALAHLTAELLATPADPVLLQLRGECNQRLGRSEAALADFDAAIAAAPACDPDLYLRRARLAASTGEAGLVRALAGLDAGLERCGAVPALLFEAIELEAALGRRDAALARVDALLATAPKSAEPHARRAALCEQFGRLDDAAGAWRACLAALDALPERRANAPAARRLRDLAGERIATLTVASEPRRR
ncbi:MAG TPA: hypothetical protein VGC54_06605 [Planctomycetota bacterium]